MKKILLGVALFTLAACNKTTQEQQTQTDSTKIVETVPISVVETTYMCVPLKQFGKIQPQHTMDDLERLFGRENIGEDSITAEGEFVGLQTVIFKGQKNEVFVSWKEDAPPFKKIMYVSVKHSQSPYKTKEGIGVGSRLNEIQARLNDNKPFSFSGFGWDYGGGCCFEGAGEKLKNMRFVLDFNEESYKDFTENEYAQFSGDRMVRSDLPIFAQKAMPVVQEMMIDLNEFE